MNEDEALAALHATLTGRDTPETIAALIGQALPARLTRVLQPSLATRLTASVKRLWGWSSMPTVFGAPVRPRHSADKLRELALLFLEARLPAGDDPAAVAALIEQANALIGKAAGRGGFKADRLDRAGRAVRGLSLSRRRYDRLFRLIARLERKLGRSQQEEDRHRLLLVAKAGLAPELTVTQLGSVLTAAFVAYYAARTKLRSEFTIAGQQKPFDDLAAALLGLCTREPGTSWYAIAHVFPRADVLARLSEADKGALLGRWFAVLDELAERLERVGRETKVDLDTMIVRRGNDSSTWNLYAAAWNRARDHWIALVEALGMAGLFDQLLPGKVMRLMAADVAAWHRSIGGAIHPDTQVWAALPRPWDVLRLEAHCDRATVERACAAAGIDPVTSGWSAARPRVAVQAFRPTPELVHGVAVANPFAAAFLRRLGAFSGRPLRGQVLDDLAG